MPKGGGQHPRDGALTLFVRWVSGDRDREQEEAARAHFDRHGRWPDEEAPSA